MKQGRASFASQTKNTDMNSKYNLIEYLKPQCCAYLWNDSDLIEIPQNSQELMPIIDVINSCEYKLISRTEAFELGFNSLADWTNENDFLFWFEEGEMLLNLPKCLFKVNG